MALRGCLRDPRKLTYHYPRGLIVVAFVPPQTALDPPAVFALIVEQGSTPAAHVVFEFYLRVLLHNHLDCRSPVSVPCESFLALFGLKFKGNTVHTVPQPGRPRAVFKDMSQVTLAASAMHLRPCHSVLPIRCRFDGAVQRRPETRPPRAAVELRGGRKELGTAARAAEHPVSVFLIKGAGAGPLRSMHPQHLKLLRC